MPRKEVPVTSPTATEWICIDFGFVAHRDDVSQIDLFIWFECVNLLPPDFTEYWPFWGEFQRFVT